MGGGFAPRFVFEAAFLILLAVGAGFANLRPVVIVAVMAAGWLLVSLIEYFAWRAASQAALRLGTLAQRAEPAREWSVNEILVPESELAVVEPEPAELTTVLPPEQGVEETEPPAAEEPEPESETAAEPEPEPEPEPARAPRRRRLRRRLRRRKAEEAAE